MLATYQLNYIASFIVAFTIRVGAGKVLWGAKDFCLYSPKLARKAFVRLLPTDLLPHVNSKKKAFMCFLQTLGIIF